MELMYPIAIIICAILSIGVFCIRFKNKVKYIFKQKKSLIFLNISSFKFNVF